MPLAQSFSLGVLSPGLPSGWAEGREQVPPHCIVSDSDTRSSCFQEICLSRGGCLPRPGQTEPSPPACTQGSPSESVRAQTHLTQV